MDKIKIFDDIKNKFFENYDAVSKKQDVNDEMLYFSRNNLENLFELIKNFLSAEGDKTTQQSIALEIMTSSLINDIPISKEGFFESPIEYLLFTALQRTMPFHISQQAYLLPQVEVCNKKYRLDIGLIKRSFNDDSEGNNVIIGIECDGYETHYGDKTKAAKTAKRIREIKMAESIEIFQYTGKEIFANAIELANKFWNYIEQNIFPPIKSNLYYDYDCIYEFVERYLKNPELVKHFYVYAYEHIDILDFMPSANSVLCKYKGYDILLDNVKSKLYEKGWEGDGEIQLLWIPPFCDLPYEDTWGILTWFVKQENNGTSFIASPYKLNFKSLDNQNWH